MSRDLRYVEMNRQSGHNPLRTGSIYQHPAAIWGTAFYDGTWNQPRPAPAPVVAVAPAPAASGAAKTWGRACLSWADRPG